MLRLQGLVVKFEVESATQCPGTPPSTKPSGSAPPKDAPPCFLSPHKSVLASGNYSYPGSYPSPLASCLEAALLYPPFAALVHNTFLTVANTGATAGQAPPGQIISPARRRLPVRYNTRPVHVSLRPKYIECSFRCSTVSYMYARSCKVHARSVHSIVLTLQAI